MIVFAWAALGAAVSALYKGLLLPAVFCAAGIWLWMYLSGLRVTVGGGCVIKSTGRRIKRNTVMQIGTVSSVSTSRFLPRLPALIKLTYPGGNVYIFGLDGRQVCAVEKAVVAHMSK